ncbi:hypothetical protein GCM10027614_73400 [Micromonospora vulcania]
MLRRGVPQQLAAGAALAVTALMVPGLLKFGGDLSGLTAVLWRVPWILPVPALVGFLAVIRLPGLARVNRVLAVALPAVLVFAFFTLGKPMWGDDSVQSMKPSWRMLETRKNVSFWIERQDRPEGLLLAPSTVMRALPQVTTKVRVVLPRDLYLTDYGPQTQFSLDRLLLARFADGESVYLPEVANAMHRVQVGTVCLWRTNKAANDAAPALGLVEFASRKSPGGMICYRVGPPGPLASGF